MLTRATITGFSSDSLSCELNNKIENIIESTMCENEILYGNLRGRGWSYRNHTAREEIVLVVDVG